MSRYTPVSAGAPPPSSYPPRPAAAQRSATSSSASSIHQPNRQQEMEAAFDDSGSDDDDDDDENLPLSRARAGREIVWDAGEDAGMPDEDPVSAPADGVDDPLRRTGLSPVQAPAAVSGSLRSTDAEPTYDFDRDYFLPPPGSPPPGAYPENYLPTGPTPLTTTPTYPSAPSAPSRFIRSLLPTHFTRAAAPSPRGSDGVFANLAAKPELEGIVGADGSDGDNTSMMAEFAAKDAPPAYNVAARDAVPPYWEHNVVAPSFGPLGSITGSGDDLLIDGLPVGNFFGFAWNLLVSMSFQFVGFLLTYVLHTTHSAKYGSRAGLGITLVQYGLYLRSRAQEIRDTGDIDPDGTDGTGFGGGFGGLFGGGGGMGMGDAVDASSSILSSAVATATSTASAALTTATEAIPTFGSLGEALQWKHDHPDSPMMSGWDAGVPSAEEVSEANDWLSFVLMCAGWFILITSLGGYWRVKRYERSLLAAQESEDDAASVPAPGISFGAIRDWYRSRSSAPTPAADTSAAADNTGYPGADLGLHEDEPAPREGGRGDNAFRVVGRAVRDWRAQFLARASAIRDFRERQRERERREEGEFMLS